MHMYEERERERGEGKLNKIMRENDVPTNFNAKIHNSIKNDFMGEK